MSQIIDLKAELSNKACSVNIALGDRLTSFMCLCACLPGSCWNCGMAFLNELSSLVWFLWGCLKQSFAEGMSWPPLPPEPPFLPKQESVSLPQIGAQTCQSLTTRTAISSTMGQDKYSTADQNESGHSYFLHLCVAFLQHLLRFQMPKMTTDFKLALVMHRKDYLWHMLGQNMKPV